MKLTFLVTLVVLAGCMLAVTYEVPDDYTTIQAAINATADGDTIIVHPGIYNERINFYGKDIFLTSDHPWNNSLAIVNSTVIDGGEGGSVVKFINGETNAARLNGFTLRNGNYTQGGGMEINGASPLVTNCFFRDNYGGNGGAIFAMTSQAKFSQCVFYNNEADFEGGVFLGGSSQCQFINCVMYDNSAFTGAGAIKNWIGSTTLLRNCIIWGNTPNQIATSGGTTVDCQYCCVQGGYAGTGNLSANPSFVAPDNCDFHLSQVSPCLNAGCPDMTGYVLPGMDMEGNPRIDGIIDLGIYESVVMVQMVADFSATPLTGYSPLLVQFTDLTTGTPTIWQWDFDNDGTTDSTIQNPAWTFQSPGLYSVKLTASNAGLNDFELKTNYINVIPVPAGEVINVPEDYPTIQAAIIASSDGDTVLVAPGDYYETLDFTGKAITVASLFITNHDMSYIGQTVINAGGSGHVVKFVSGEGPNSGLIGFTVTGGVALGTDDYVGGGIFCQNASPLLKNLDVVGNEASEGGGIGLMGSSPHILNVKVYDNSAGMSGGGIGCHSGSSPLIENTLVNANSAMVGGGISAQVNSSPVLINCTVANNTVGMPQFAGGFDCYGTCTPVVMNCIFYNNSMHQVVNSSQMYITHSCIQGGQAGVANDAGAILHWGEGNISDIPQFTNDLNYDYHLLDTSPCLLQGESFFTIEPITYAAPLFDLEMVPRPLPVNTAPDMGAFENPGALEADFLADQTSGSAPLTVAFSDLSGGAPSVWQWDFDNDGDIDSEAQNPVWVYQTAGVYTVTLTVIRGTLAVSETKPDYITVNPVSAEDESNTPIPFVTVYPNPVRNNAGFRIRAEKGREIILQLFNVKGQLVRETRIDATSPVQVLNWDTTAADGREVDSGIYFYKLQSSGSTQSGKLIIIR